MLNESISSIDAWPVVTLLYEADRKLSIADALSQSSHFSTPQSAYATLGMRKDSVWLRVPITLAEKAADEWVLDVDYSLLNRIDVYVVSDQQVLRQAVLGNAQPFRERPLAGRSHAISLDLKPGSSIDIYLRVETIGAKILPITLNSFSAFHNRAIHEQMLQGVLISVALFLLLCSLLQWFSLREPLYLKYCFLVLFSALFSIHFFGIGAQYLWTDIQWMERHMAGVTALLTSASTALFIEDALRQEMGRWLRNIIKVAAALLIASAILHGLDLMDIRVVSMVMSSVGLVSTLVAVPSAISRVRGGDLVGAYFLLASAIYFIARGIMIATVTGYLGANFWTMHSFIIGCALDMLIFMWIAILRANAIHIVAKRATLERDALHTLAHTDPLTGLLNRRGLNDSLKATLPNTTPEKLLAVYMLDMDNFKPVNDQFGHDVGDELLMVVAARLRAAVRAGDVVARTGGDEFVVVAKDMLHASQAQELGQKLLDIFRTPFSLEQKAWRVGITVGYCLAPSDGNDANSLLKMADAAMYAGKQQGKNCLRRADAPIS